MFTLTLVLICIFAGAIGQICFKYGLGNIHEINGMEDLLKFKTIFEIITNKYIILGVFLYGSSFILWMAALSTLDVSFMYPLLSLGYVITAILAVIFLGENITIIRWIGIILIVTGCFFITNT
ncbi:MAG: SMR family transporter [Candidatus Atribacteria bacterium]|nr:SMR family transporter [Candidatus Atribacteria bacterium]